jgi:hypothetical protein
MFVPRGIRPVARAAGTVSVCWAAKGGSGTTVVVAALGLTMQPPVLLVDLAGDLPATYGLAEPAGPGAHDWLRSDAGPEGLDHLAVDVVPGLHLIPAGSPPAHPEHPRWADLAAALTADHRTVVVDAGTGMPPAALREAGRSLLVTRACYLSLRRAASTHHRPDAVVLVEEPGRALRAGDVETALGAPVIAAPAIDPAVARAVDAGLLAARLPHGVRRDLRGAA